MSLVASAPAGATEVANGAAQQSDAGKLISAIIAHIKSDYLELFVVLVLLGASVTSWVMIFVKISSLKRAHRAADEFEERFWSGSDLGAIYKQVSSSRYQLTGMEAIFEAGFKEFARLRKQGGADARALVEGAHRSMRAALSRELDFLETHLSFLATVGSTSPYIGLFGTVWGIMLSMQKLTGGAGQATIDRVATPISVALGITALGLFAAIPAVIAYNKFNNNVERLSNRYHTFVDEFSTILQRHAHD
jgi:biopolymer transport protein TolQ